MKCIHLRKIILINDYSLFRGEGSAGYSMQFRHLELSNVLSAVLGVEDDIHLNFCDALSYDGDDDMSTYHMDAFQGAMQFVDTAPILSSKEKNENEKNNYNIPSDLLVAATKRCSLIRASYEIIAEGDDYNDLASQALNNGSLDEFMIGGENENGTWRVRLRQYGSMSVNGKEKRYGKNMRSPLSQERHAVNQMKELFLQFGGNVNLKNPDCSLYIFEGLTTTTGKYGNEHSTTKKKILARLLTKGPNTSFIAPKTRICVTNTPLCPIAAYTMCNLARVKDGDKILDPYAGSCAILLAATMMTSTPSTASSIQSVGIEISHNGIVNRDDIVKDFTARNFTVPSAIIRGDSTNSTIRQIAKEAISDDDDDDELSSFDLIITDPPYGIRESSKGGGSNDDDDTISSLPPLDQLFQSIVEDRENEATTRLLKVGGRLVAFVPNIPGQDIRMVLPSEELTNEAGMKLQEFKEQPLNDSLSRWLVAYTCER